MDRRRFAATLAGIAGGLALAPGGILARAAPRVNGARLMGTIFALAEHGKNPEGGVSRVAYSDADLAGRAYVQGLMREAGLEVSVDLAGNLVGRRAGLDASLKPIAFGSHIDSVPKGGNYDGPVGSLGAIEVARTLRESGIATRHPLEVLIFQNEEGGKTGSRVLDGEMEPRELELRTASGLTIGEGIRRIGGDPARLAEARKRPGDYAAFLEVHIEQGAILEREGIPIGVVEGIVGLKRWAVVWEGFANHAGTTPMDQRQDALLAAARFVELAHRVARDTPGTQVATVGKLEVSPGAPNVIPGRVAATLEIRDLDDPKIDALQEAVRSGCEAIARETGTRFTMDPIYHSAGARMHPHLMAAVREAAEGLGLPTRQMPSGAGHDAQSMAHLGPAGMIFLPSVQGISHSPRELSHPQDIVNATNVLLHAILALDGAPVR